MNRPLPPALDLTHSQQSGWACVWCGTSLERAPDAQLVGRAVGWLGAHDMSCDAYACSDCQKQKT